MSHPGHGDHSRKAVIEFLTDGIMFKNPGDSFSGERQQLNPGEKDVRLLLDLRALAQGATLELAT